MCDIVVKKFAFAISSPDEFLLVFDFRALWRSGLSARVPESQKLNMHDQLASQASNPLVIVTILEI